MTLRFLAVAASILGAAFTAVDSRAANSQSDIEVISQYVVNHKHWPAKSFRIERKECDCAYALYRIVYLPEDGKPISANSQSFAVYYDEHLHKIIKETQYQ